MYRLFAKVAIIFLRLFWIASVGLFPLFFISAQAGVDGKKPEHGVITCETCSEMVEIPGGSFMMGATETEYRGATSYLTLYVDETPRHEEKIERFFLAIHDVTREQFARFAEETKFTGRGCQVFNGKSSRLDANADWASPGFKQGDKDPVVCVSWNDAQRYIDWLNSKAVSGDKLTYRLPTESEWEYAARAGTVTAAYWGSATQCKFANARDVSMARSLPNSPHVDCDDGYINTSPVGFYLPNPWGLYDMLGNVSQWTRDCSRLGYSSPSSSPLATKVDCSMKAARGASWATIPFGVRAAARQAYKNDTRSNTLGFRLAADIKK